MSWSRTDVSTNAIAIGSTSTAANGRCPLVTQLLADFNVSPRLSPSLPLVKADDTEVEYDEYVPFVLSNIYHHDIHYRLPAPLAEALITQRQLLDLTNGSVSEYVHRLRQDVLSQGPQPTINGCPIRAALATIEHLRDSVCICSDHILNELGCGEEWRQVETILQAVRSALCGLQELLCEVM